MSNVIKCYGNIKIPSHYCPDCKRTAFVIDNELQCCGKKLEEQIYTKFQRISEDVNKRKPLSEKNKKLILDLQNYSCFYCLTPFNFEVKRNGKVIKLKIEFDHQVPYSFLNNNDTDNIVASCNVCNRIKSNFCFQTTDEARIYIQNIRESKGYDF